VQHAVKSSDVKKKLQAFFVHCSIFLLTGVAVPIKRESGWPTLVAHCFGVDWDDRVVKPVRFLFLFFAYLKPRHEPAQRKSG
jgi:hypothetical protein